MASIRTRWRSICRSVDLSNLSLWLATLAKDHPFTFLDHSLRAGDSLVGLTREQIIHFSWEPTQAETLPKKKKTSRSSQAASDQPLATLFSDPLADRMRTVTEYRQRILAARDDKPYEQLRQELDMADEALSLARLAGDCVIAAFFSSDKDRERLDKLATLSRQMVQYLSPQGKTEDRQPLTEAVRSLHGGDRSLKPFHWDIEFPEVFITDEKDRKIGGFDAIIGNPPFISSTLLWSVLGPCYRDFVRSVHDSSSERAVDMVAHFFRRSFSLLRKTGTIGLLATNTICQGDTRQAGLHYICDHDGCIYSAQKRLQWPGNAAVVVSVVHIAKSAGLPQKKLGNKPVNAINSFLFSSRAEWSPKQLQENEGRSFHGVKIYGAGFAFDDKDTQSIATPVSEMHRLIAKDARNQEKIFPYIGGEEVNSHPSQQNHRYVINFGQLPEQLAREWPDLMAIVETKVRPQRNHMGGYSVAERRKNVWWQFETTGIDLQAAINGMKRCLVLCRVAPFLATVFQPTSRVFADSLVVFPYDDESFFSIIQSRLHEMWSRFLGSSMKDDLRYSPTDCFHTFPFPKGFESNAALETAGREYYEFRAALMVRNNEGLTKTYNRFHDPHETSPEILRLRELHAAMDRAVLEAYGWHDLAQTATCEFLLDYEDDEDDEQDEPSSGRRRKKPWRYRWPDDFRDEVLARLLALNAKRHEEEVAAGKAAEANSEPKKPKPKPTRQPKPRKNRDSDPPDSPPTQKELF